MSTIKTFLLIIFIVSLPLLGQSGNFVSKNQMSDYEFVSVVDEQIHYEFGLVYPINDQLLAN